MTKLKEEDKNKEQNNYLKEVETNELLEQKQKQQIENNIYCI